MKFNQWLDTFVSEKGLDLECVITVRGELYGDNFIPLGCVIEQIKSASSAEQSQIKDIIVKIDFANGDVMDFFKHLAKAMAI